MRAPAPRVTPYRLDTVWLRGPVCQDRRVFEEPFTRWGRDLDPNHVLGEYPRPQLVRDSYLNLNGWWDYAVSPAYAAPPREYDGQILVTSCPESSLSGVGRQLQRHERLRYRRRVELPKGFVPPGGRPQRPSGAVD